MWSYGVLYYYLISGKLPETDEENKIDIDANKFNLEDFPSWEFLT